MSSDQTPGRGAKSIVDVATALGSKVYSESYGSISQAGQAAAAAVGAATGGTGSGPAATVAGVASGGASTLFGLAQEMAGLALHTAGQISESLVEAAGELETLVARPADGAAGPRSDVALPDERDRSTPPPQSVLVLGATSPGRTTSATFEVRNPGDDTVDAVHLRCGGLFAPGDVRIAGSHVTFAPLTVEVAPGATVTATCTVEVPERAKRAHYVGLIEANGLAGVQLLVSLDVL